MTFLPTAVAAARLGGQILMDYRSHFKAREKAPRDLVTDADVASQEAIEAFLRKEHPDHQFVGEEGDAANRQVSDQQWCWVVDPLDGTANYAHRLQSFAVSVAVIKDGQPHAGVVYDPIMNELYAAELGQGATLNDEPIAASRCAEIEEAMIAFSFAAGIDRNSPDIARFIEVLVRCQALRRLGSAALNMCYVAAGRLDAYWAYNVKAWDVAAGALIAREAGALLTDPSGGPFEIWDPKLALASTSSLHRQMLECLSQVDR